MSDMMNQHCSHEVPSTLGRPKANQRTFTDAMLAYLNGASPWLRFIGIMGIIYSGLMVGGGLLFFFAVPVMEGISDGIAGFGFSFEIFGWIGAWGGILYMAMGICMLIPSIYVHRFGAKIRSYARTGEDRDLEQAFKSNKSLWKFCGILFISGIVFVVLSMAFGVLAMVALGFYI